LDGSRAYLANEFSGNVSVIDTSTNRVVATATVGSAPYGVAITPDGTRVYVANTLSNNVSVIDTSTDTVVATVAVENGPRPLGNFIGALQQCSTPHSNCYAHADRDANCHTDTNSKLNPYTKASPYAKASSDPTASSHAAAIRTSRVDRIQMNNLRGVKGPVVRRFIPLAPSSVVLRIVAIRPAAVPACRRWGCGCNSRFAGACNVDGIGQGSRPCISRSGIFRSLNIERRPIRIKSTHHQREITYV